jgi:class 3 adenylate cyclase
VVTKEVALLVVDDEVFNRNFIERQLRHEGYENISFAENGRVALELMLQNSFDLVLLDIEMPEVDGYEVLEQVKLDMRLRDIPIIVISSIDDIDSIARCIELGAEDYLPKPFNPILLRARLSACLERKKNKDKQLRFMEQIREEKEKSNRLLEVILPFAAARELKTTGRVEPRAYEEVAILFCDIVGFTHFCSQHPAGEVVRHLEDLIEAFETISGQYEMEKIKTIGDEYMATAGLLMPNSDPLASCVQAGLAMISAARNMSQKWEVRVGVNIGPVVAGMVGKQKYQFDVWGDTVNLAARMTGYGSTGTVVVTQEAWLHLDHICRGRNLGAIDVKGKGPIEMVECLSLR